MDRYSTLYATNKAGGYGRLGSSQKLRPFLERRIGAADVTEVVEAVEQVLRVQEFVVHPGYAEERANNKPLAIRYAPMHLYKKPNMPANMRQFVALGVNGSENRTDSKRVIFYTHTHMLPVGLMHKSGEYNYLDQLFGTRLLSWQEVAAHREGKRAINFDTVPDKVAPVIHMDRSCVFSAVEALYAGQNVVISLEEGAEFNTRAKDILMQIYSLLQPKLATEVGFATYQNVAEIPWLCKETSIRIFVVPFGVKLDGLEGGFRILDLAAGVKAPEASELRDALKLWAGMSWNARQPLMEALFASVEEIQDADRFVKVTNDYFQARKDLADWAARNQGKFDSLEALAAEVGAAPFWKNLPNPQAELKSCLGTVLAEGVTIESLNAGAMADLFFAPENKRKGFAGRYKYGLGLGGVNPEVLADQISQRQKAKDDETHLVVLAEVQAAHEADNAKHEKILQDIKAKVDILKERHEAEKNSLTGEFDARQKNMLAAFDAEKQQLTADYEAKIAAEAAAHQADNEAAAKALADLKEQFAARMQQLIDEHNSKMAALTAAHNEKLAAQEAAFQEQLTQLENAFRAKDAEWKAKVEELTGKLKLAATAVETLRGEKADLQTRLDQADAVWQGRISKTEQDLTDARTTISDQKNKIRELEDTVKSGRNMKELITVGAIAAVAGILVASLVFFLVGMLTGGNEETVPSTIPVETTLPVETTDPVETTLPEETTAPTEPADGEINWSEVLYYSGMTAVETDEGTMENLLSDFVLEEGYEVLAIVTDEANGFRGQFGTVLPDSFAVLMNVSHGDSTVVDQPEETTAPAETTEPAETTTPGETTETEPQVQMPAKLMEEASLILEGEQYCLVVVGGSDIREAGLKLFNLVNPETGDVRMAVPMEDGTVLELAELLEQTLEAEPWWFGITGVSVNQYDLDQGQTAMGSSRKPIAAVFTGEGTVYVYDYTDDAAKAQEMLGIQQTNGRTAAEVEGLIAIHYVAD